MKRIAPGAAAFVAAILVALLGLAASADPPPDPPPAEPRGVVTLRLLGVNDLHGHLEPPRPGLGGAAWLAAHLDRASLPGRTIRVHAGDVVGATPLISSWFHDEPTIAAANLMRFDVGTVGNHELDEGGEELLRLLRGGRREGPAALKRDADGELVNTSSADFAGARFPYIAANTFDRDGLALLPPTRVVERAGARVGFIGVTTPSTPDFLLPRYASPFRFTDISHAVDEQVTNLRRRGVEAIVVLAHAGAPAAEGDGSNAVGEIVEEAREMSDAVDVVIAGHSHSLLNLRVPNASGRGDKLVVEAASYGMAYDLVDVAVDRATGEVVSKSAAIPPVTHDRGAPHAEVETLVDRVAARVAPVGDRVVGETDRPLTRAGGELGRLAADAQRALARSQLALVNPGSLRADVDAGPIAYGELFEAQAYDHRVLRMELTGREVRALLERSTLYRSGVPGGGPLDPGATYTVAVNELLATRPGFPAGRGATPVGTEVEALAAQVARFTAAQRARHKRVTGADRRSPKLEAR